MFERIILGIRFLNGSAADAVVLSDEMRGLVVIPSAPVLVRMTEDAAHREALLHSDMAIADSGLMVLLWRLFTREQLERVSGLEYLKLLLEKLKCSTFSTRLGGHDQAPTDSSSVAGSILWIMPTQESRDRNLAWLQANDHRATTADCYVAPRYPIAGPLSDLELLAWVKQRQPKHIIICLGGGVQERLGYFLKQAIEREAKCGVFGDNAARLPGIHCVGAAIGFLTGDQVRIPALVDYH